MASLSSGQVRLLQTNLNERLAARGRHAITVDGDYGPETAEAVHLVKYLLGFPVSSLDTGPSLWFRKVVQHPSLRPPTYLSRARSRKKHLATPPSRTGSPRAVAVNWAGKQVGTTERPAGSNMGPGITTWQKRLGSWLVGQPWCGTFCGNALLAAGVAGVNSRIAGVALIEDDARAKRAPYRGWTTNPGAVLRGDLAVMFGRGVHVELVVSVDRKAGVVHTIGGNTSSGNAGSQSNGGGVFRRTRSLRDVHGFALVNYPG